MNNQDKVSVTAVPFNPQTQAFTPAPTTPAIAPVAPVIPNMPTPSPTITADNLGVQKINVPAAPVAQTVAIPVNQADQILKDTAVAETEAQKASQDLSKSILSLIPNLQGQTQELATQQRAAGLPEMKQNLQNLNNQILTKTAELNQDEIRLAQSVQNIEDKPIAMEFITGQQQSVQRNAQIARALKASEIGVLNATAIGMQGNIALAEQTAKQAVETKYAPYKEALEAYKMQLEALQPILNADEKKQARAQEIKTKLAFNDIEKRQKAEEDVSKLLINAASQNAPQGLLAKAKLEKDPAKAAMILGQYAGDFYKTELLKNQIATEKAQRAKIYSDIAANRSTGAGGAVLGLEGINPLKFKDAQARTDFTKAGAVVEAIKATLTGAQKDKDGNYYGLGYGGGAKPEVFLDQAGQTNRAFLAGINLKTQQWASGASLTKEQIDMVNKMVPQNMDADSTITRKLNALEKYMNNEQKAIARAQGQSVIEQPEPNVFTQALGQPASKYEGTSIIKNISDTGIDFALPATTNVKVK